jgi:tellurite resistance protein TerC
MVPPIADLTGPLPLWAWASFFLLITAMLAIDLGLFQRKPHVMKMREALAWCAVWLSLALAFNALLWWWRGAEAGQEFLAAYLVELCLSVDNVFVFILVFAYFKVAPVCQHRVLFWGIVGAVLMRGAFILVGVGVIHRFHWVLYLFGAFLVYTGAKMALPERKDAAMDPGHNVAVRLFRRFFPVSPVFEGGTAAASPRHSSSCSLSSRRPTWSSPSTRCPPCWPSPPTASSPSPLTSSPSSASARFILPSAASCSFSVSSSSASP